MFSFYVENPEPPGSLTKNGLYLDKNQKYSVYIFSIWSPQIGS